MVNNFYEKPSGGFIENNVTVFAANKALTIEGFRCFVCRATRHFASPNKQQNNQSVSAVKKK